MARRYIEEIAFIWAKNKEIEASQRLFELVGSWDVSQQAMPLL